MAGERASGISAPLTLMGNRPLTTLFIGARGVSVPSEDSYPAGSCSNRPGRFSVAFCFRNFLICAVTVTSLTSLSFATPSFGGLVAWNCITSGGREIQEDCHRASAFAGIVISARQSGNSDIWFR